jgi:hypothetical protein
VKETCHNKKKKKLAILVVPIKVIELVVKVIAQLFKPTKVPFKYPCITYFSSKHRAPNCPRKTEIYNMFWTKPIITTTIITKKPKPSNVLVNVVVTIMTHSQVPKQ